MSKYETLTDYIVRINNDKIGMWVGSNTENDGSYERPLQMPSVVYTEVIDSFVNDVYKFVDTHEGMELTNYSDILKGNNLEWDYKLMAEADLKSLDGQCIMALIVGAIRANRFSEGTLLQFFEEGVITKWLERLKEFEE